VSVSVALHGNLRDFGISEVFQLIGQQRKTGVLEIAGPDERVELHFDGGAIVVAAPVGPHPDAALGDLLVRIGLLTRERLGELEREREHSLQALRRLLLAASELSAAQLDEAEDLLTRETIFQVLRWREGSFHFSARAVADDRDPSRRLGAEQVLMDGLRMLDEWQTFADRVPTPEVVFQRSGRFDAERHRFEEGSERLERAERLWLLVDGRLPARRIIDLSRLGTFEATRRLAELRDLGLIEPLAPEKVQRRPRAPRAPRAASWLRAGLGTAIPLAGLAALAVLPPAFVVPRPGPPELAVSRDPVREAHVAFGARRLRAAIDAHRWATGRYPEGLLELVEGGFVAPSALTGPEGRPYYYARRGDGYVLLAPEP
jgi:hypothetical protein